MESSGESYLGRGLDPDRQRKPVAHGRARSGHPFEDQDRRWRDFVPLRPSPCVPVVALVPARLSPSDRCQDLLLEPRPPIELIVPRSEVISMEQRRAAGRGQLSRQRGLPSTAGAVHRDQPRRPEPRRAPFHEGDEVVNAHLLTAGEQGDSSSRCAHGPLMEVQSPAVFRPPPQRTPEGAAPPGFGCVGQMNDTVGKKFATHIERRNRLGRPRSLFGNHRDDLRSAPSPPRGADLDKLGIEQLGDEFR